MISGETFIQFPCMDVHLMFIGVVTKLMLTKQV